MVTRARVASAHPDRSGVPWLDEDERAAWLSLLRLTVKLPARLDARLGREAGLSLFEYTILAVLSEQPDATLRMSRLASLTDASASKLSHAARHLERRGLLVREPDPEDGRCIRAVLTDPGRALVRAAAPGHVTAVRELFLDPLTPAQLRALHEASKQILVRIDDDA
jgi:DNA-binding MarR family transcriptional regulator